MTTPQRPSRGADRQALDRLMVEVNRARTALQECHRDGARWDERRLREELLAALEAYAAAVADVGAPLPYRIRDELSLYRTLSAGP